ncbi:hypothetical protein QE152_g35733 [Popillia japonica]
MVVKIGKLENLDVECLRKANFKSVFVRYLIPNLAVVKTSEKKMARNIRFNEAHAHFTNFVSSVSIAEYIQTNRLFLEICGVREETDNVQPSIFGIKYTDRYFGRRMTPMRYILNLHNDVTEQLESIEVLAVAAYDLTSLLTPVCNYSSKESCHHPDNLLYQQRNSFSVQLEMATANNINIKKIIRTKSNSPLSEFSLLRNGTSLQLEVYFMAPLTHITNNIYYRYSFYNRMLLIVYSIELAATLLNDILSYNQGNITKEIIIPDLSKYDVGSFAFFLEGVFEHKIGMVWKQYRKYPADEIIIYFNSDSVFEERLYTAFSGYRGFCIITLQKPLRDILAQEAFYVEGNVPLPCWQAAKKLDILFRATTLKDIFQYNLLPSPEELISLNLEWGIPMKWNAITAI